MNSILENQRKQNSNQPTYNHNMEVDPMKFTFFNYSFAIMAVLFSSEIATARTPVKERVFLAKDYGVKSTTPAETRAAQKKGVMPADQGPAMLKLVEAVNSYGGKARIVFEPGDIHWYGEELKKKSSSPSHNEVFRSHATFKNLDGITIEAPHVHFFFMDVDLGMFRFQHCKNVVLKGFSVDYFRCASSTARIVGRTNEYIDLKFLPEFPVDGNIPVIAIDVYDSKTHGVATVKQYGEYAHRHGGMSKTKKIADQTLRVFFNDKKNYFPDRGLVGVKHRMYSADAFRFEYCNEILCEYVTINSCTGMGFHADASHNITLRKCSVEPPNGSKRLISSNADASHFSHASGTVKLEDCRFISSGDDGNNTLAQYINIEKIEDRDTIIASRHDANYLYPFPLKEGQTLEFVDKKELVPLCTPKIDKVEFLTSSKQYRIKLSKKLPGKIAIGTHVFCIVDMIPKYIARRVVCKNIRGRGLLSQCRGVLVENCHFENLSNGGLLFTADTNSWGQAATLHDVIIRNNTFKNDNHGYGPCFGEITIGSIIPGFTAGAPESAGNILIENNKIFNTGQAWLALMGASNVEVCNNTIRNCMMSPLDRLHRWGYGAVMLERVRKINFYKNRLFWTRGGDPKFTQIFTIDTPKTEITHKRPK